MINEIRAMARSHYEHTNQRFTHVYLGPRAYAALEVETARDRKTWPAAAAAAEWTIAGLIVMPCGAEGVLFR